MTQEQNEGSLNAPESAAPQQPGQPQGQHRRRRRRRKGGKGPATPQANAQPAAQNQQPRPNNPPPRQKAPQQNRFYQKNGNGNGNGQGQGQGQGGPRRKGKQRRQAPSFVGPMDHSYRVANGNIAEGHPSTIEYRNGNGNGNINPQNGFQNEAAYVEPPPAPIREDAPIRIFCFIEDLFVLAKIQETARKLGIKVGFVKADKDIVAKLAGTSEEDRPSLIVFDLNNANAKPLTLIPRIKSKLKRGTSVIGFLSHIQGDLKAKAIEAGCDMVMPRSAFSQNLPNLLRRHGLEEELEAVEA